MNTQGAGEHLTDAAQAAIAPRRAELASASLCRADVATGCQEGAARPPILLTARDREQLAALLRDAGQVLEPELASFLGEEIARAETVPDSGSRLVAGLGSEVKFIDHAAQRIRTGRLVRPDQATDPGCISILSRTGSALVGLGPGQSIAWTHGGTSCRFSVLEVRADARSPRPRGARRRRLARRSRS